MESDHRNYGHLAGLAMDKLVVVVHHSKIILEITKGQYYVILVKNRR